jgi:hypothetical protein
VFQKKGGEDDSCLLKLRKEEDLLQVSVEGCDYYCGMGVGLDGTHQGFKQIGPGSEDEGFGKY